jgi:hypothetical protein
MGLGQKILEVLKEVVENPNTVKTVFDKKCEISEDGKFYGLTVVDLDLIDIFDGLTVVDLDLIDKGYKYVTFTSRARDCLGNQLDEFSGLIIKHKVLSAFRCRYEDSFMVKHEGHKFIVRNFRDWLEPHTYRGAKDFEILKHLTEEKREKENK